MIAKRANHLRVQASAISWGIRSLGNKVLASIHDAVMRT